jgi:indole-3-glycerol phosphate synthase
MQSLVGRNATEQEIQQYGAELLAAQRANPGLRNETADYYIGQNRKASITGSDISTGVDASSFLQNLISGSADAKSYRAATGYFNGMIQALQNMKSE